MSANSSILPNTFTVDKIDDIGVTKRSSQKLVMSTGNKSSYNETQKSYFTQYERAQSVGNHPSGVKRRSLITTMEGGVQTKQQMINYMNQTMIDDFVSSQSPMQQTG